MVVTLILLEAETGSYLSHTSHYLTMNTGSCESTILTITIHLRAVIPKSGDYQHQPLTAAALTTALPEQLITSQTGTADSGAQYSALIFVLHP